MSNHFSVSLSSGEIIEDSGGPGEISGLISDDAEAWRRNPFSALIITVSSQLGRDSTYRKINAHASSSVVKQRSPLRWPRSL
jgi:hypothetical protein